jgi:hypothetical protein
MHCQLSVHAPPTGTVGVSTQPLEVAVVASPPPALASPAALALHPDAVHVEPAPHAFPHSPQFALLALRSVQTSEQITNPALHVPVAVGVCPALPGPSPFPSTTWPWQAIAPATNTTPTANACLPTACLPNRCDMFVLRSLDDARPARRSRNRQVRDRTLGASIGHHVARVAK